MKLLALFLIFIFSSASFGKDDCSSDYLEGKADQLSIWLESDHVKKNVLRGRLEETLKNGRIIRDVTSDFTITAPTSELRIYELDSGVLGLFKFEKWDTSADDEVLAYNYDKLLGIDIVPATVTRKIDERLGSMQYFFKESIDLNRANYRSFFDDKNEYLQQMGKMRVFDYLISNIDRADRNILLLTNHANKLAAIDHGLSVYNSHGFEKYRGLDRYGSDAGDVTGRRFLLTEEGRKFQQMLKKITIDKLKEAFPLLSDTHLTYLFQKKEYIRVWKESETPFIDPFQ